MELTSVSLLDRLRETPLREDWVRFVALYQPFIHRFIKLDPAMTADAEDISQDVMAKLVQHLPRFNRERDGSFRAWLRTITVNEVSYFWRQRQRRKELGGYNGHLVLESLYDPNNDLSRLWDREHTNHVVARLQELIESDFEPKTWQAFRLRVFESKSTKEVSVLLGISENSVDVAKSRVLNRLRKEAAGFLDE